MTLKATNLSPEQLLLWKNHLPEPTGDKRQNAIIPSNRIANAVDRVVGSYFDSINQGLYQQTVSLFTDRGVLALPFHPQIVGKENIYQYLQGQNQDIYLEAQQRHITPFQNQRIKIDVQGKLRTPSQDINVTWNFLLNPKGKITIVQTIVLVSLQQLEQFSSHAFQGLQVDRVEPNSLGEQPCLRIIFDD